MARFRIIVKGQKEDAGREAEHYGLKLIDTGHVNQHNEYIGQVDGREADIFAWFSAQTTSTPFPPGTLLLFNPVKE